MAYIKLDERKCKSCYLCIKACPKGLLQKSEKVGMTGNPVVEFNDINGECLGCACCALACPDLAVTEVYK